MTSNLNEVKTVINGPRTIRNRTPNPDDVEINFLYEFILNPQRNRHTKTKKPDTADIGIDR